MPSLAVPLGRGERVALQRAVPASAKAYEYYLRANELGSRSDTWQLARSLYERCLDEDPAYAPAWARLGRIHRVPAKYGTEEKEDNLTRAEAAFGRALDINPDLQMHVYVQGFVSSLRALLEGNRDDALAWIERTLAGGFPDPEGLYYLASELAYLGETKRATEVLDQSVGRGFVCFSTMTRDPWLDPLRGDPRFTGILRQA